ncbi:hypothetical protein GCM10028895_25270 [Pontibacter rugosus]
MKVALNKILKLVPIIALGALAFACEDDPDKLDPMRMFTPAGDVKAVSGESQVRLTWNPSLYTTNSSGVTYTVDVAADSLFTTPVVLSVQTDTAGVVFTDEQLEVRKRYFARIRANALGDRPESKSFAPSSGFTIRGMQIFTALLNSDITDKAVLLKWRETAGLTRIVLTPQSAEGRPIGEPIEVPVSEEDMTAGQKFVNGLSASTACRAEIFQGNRMAGYLSFTTNAPTVGNIINLTSFTDRPSVLQDTLLQVESGSIIVLKKGMTYNISSAVLLDRSLTIMSENTVAPGRANVFFTSNFDFKAGAQVDSVVFKDVTLTGNKIDADYVFNIGNASTIGTIKFESSIISNFRGVTRIKTGSVSVGKFIVKNSIVNNLYNYGVLAIDNEGARVDNIVLTNSTFYKIDRPITSRSDVKSIVIENSTFHDTPESGRYLIDFVANSVTYNVTQGITFQNNIVGRGKPLAGRLL